MAKMCHHMMGHMAATGAMRAGMMDRGMMGPGMMGGA